MKILEYDEVDPIEVLHLNLLGLNFALTPERVKLTRQYDSRPFPFFALYAEVEGVLAGQVGVFRLPMTTIEGSEDVGGVWAVLTSPSFKRRGIASRLLEEAHERMHLDGLRFSTLGTSQFRVAHMFYRKHGYQDVFSSPSLLFPRTALKGTIDSLSIEQADADQLYMADRIFQVISQNQYGFSKRFMPFMSSMVAIGEIALGKAFPSLPWAPLYPLFLALCSTRVTDSFSISSIFSSFFSACPDLEKSSSVRTMLSALLTLSFIMPSMSCFSFSLSGISSSK